MVWNNIYNTEWIFFMSAIPFVAISGVINEFVYYSMLF